MEQSSKAGSSRFEEIAEGLEFAVQTEINDVPQRVNLLEGVQMPVQRLNLHE